MATQISVLNEITLITLQATPAKVDFIAEVFEQISKEKMNVDMISMSPTHASLTELSFTISDNDLITALKMLAEIKKSMEVKSIVSSLNYKISVYDKDMKNTPGIASKFFSAIRDTDADIRLITTSEVEISILVSESDYEKVLEKIESAFSN